MASVLLSRFLPNLIAKKQERTTMACACRLARYCGRECQLAHWKAHKKDHRGWEKAKTEQQQQHK
jgi:hypothetical protein